jgi:hypothetical protein
MLTFKRLAFGVGMLFSVTSTAEAGGTCRNCFEKVEHPALYRTVAETVQVRPAQTVVHVTPAQYGMVHETRLVRPEQIIVRETPARLGTVAERVMVSPPRKEWQVTVDAYGRQIGCWVKVPAQYALQERTVVIRPAQFEQYVIPAGYETRARKVLIAPEQVQRQVIPAQYQTQVRSELVQPASRSWQPLHGGRARLQ